MVRKSQVLALRAILVLLIAACSFPLCAQQSTANAVVPTLVSFSGMLAGSNGKPLTSITGVTFSLYVEQQGGAPLWLETQNVQPDKNGNYTVQLGAATSQGLPSSLFVSGQARWLEVQAQGQDPQARIMLLSVPYALKAGDAQTLGGQPASAFATASGGSAPGPNGVVNNAITGGGTTDYVPLWLSKTKLGSSKIFQSAAGDLGIGTATPAANLDVNGTSDIRDTLTLFPKSTDPALALNGTAFEVSSKGLVTFVSGQTFPGTGDGTITGVTAGTDLTGGGSTGNVTLNLDTTKVPQLAANNTFSGTQTINNNVTVTATGTTLTASGGALGLSGSGSSTGVYGASSSGIGVYGTSSSGWAVYGTSGSSRGVYGASGSGTGVVGTSNNGNGIEGESNGTSAGNTGVYGLANGPALNATYGVIGNNTGTNIGVGVYGQDSTSGEPSGTGSLLSGKYGAGVWGDGGIVVSGSSNVGVFGTTDDSYAGFFENNSTGAYPAVYAEANTTAEFSAIGVLGEAVCCSSEYENVFANAGVWGDSGGASGESAGIVGTAGNNSAGDFYNDSSTAPTIYLENAGGGPTGGVAMATHEAAGDCAIGAGGDVACTGKVASVVATEGGARKVSLYAMQSPENWFEDFGSGTLVNGSATIALDPTFATTVNTTADYHVFLAPNGDCKGLYVSQKSGGSFEVRELGGGQSSVAFDYRIVAKRSGYENARFEDVTAQFKAIQAQSERLHQPRPGRDLMRRRAGPRVAPGQVSPPAAPPAVKMVAAPGKPAQISEQK